jgi:hypothetical protein
MPATGATERSTQFVDAIENGGTVNQSLMRGRSLHRSGIVRQGLLQSGCREARNSAFDGGFQVLKFKMIFL